MSRQLRDPAGAPFPVGGLRSLVPERLKAAYRKLERERSLGPLGRRLLAEDRQGIPADGAGPAVAARSATDWLCRAQDMSASADGGVARHYSLVDGWSASYPETTGYIVPTMIEMARNSGRTELLVRAKRMLDWLVQIQLPSGAYQGGRIDQEPVEASTFDTGQILLGLAAGVSEFQSPPYREAMHSAANFLKDSQDADGCWRQHRTPFAAPGEKAYETHVAWGLFEAARLSPASGYGEAGLRQVEWAIACQTPNGWFEKNCLQDNARPFTHTIGYALRGVIEAYRYSNDKRFLNSALLAAGPLARCIRPDGYLPGRLNRDWNPAADYACLTGSSQIAACLLLLDRLTGQRQFTDAALRANGFVRRTIIVDRDPDIDGGVKGSFPVDGEYGRFEFLNWAAKFFIDACLLEVPSEAAGSA